MHGLEGSGVLWTLTGGVLGSQTFAQTPKEPAASALHFVQISDTHLGFNKPANADVTATLQATIDKINALPDPPEFIIHTIRKGRVRRLAKDDALGQALCITGLFHRGVDDFNLQSIRSGGSAALFELRNRTN